MTMPDLTPPPMSESEIGTMYKKLTDKARAEKNPAHGSVLSLARAIEAHVNEQWRQRLEPVTHGRHGTVMVDGAIVCCNEHDREPCPQQPERRCASCPGNVTLYRIKEQG